MPTYAKAIAALISTALASLAVVLTGPAASLGALTDGQWITVAATSLAAALAIYTVPNGAPKP